MKFLKSFFSHILYNLQSKECYKVEKKLQDLLDGYKTIIVLNNSLTFYLSIDEKKFLLYLQTVKRLQDTYMINHYQVVILQPDQDSDHGICIFFQFNSHTIFPRSLISNV